MKKIIFESNHLPLKTDIRLLYGLSMIIAFLVALASGIGIIYPNRFYPAADLRYTFFPNDIVNLATGLPLLLISLWLVRRGKLIGLLCWPGAILYVFYVYFPYIICVPFDWPFLIYLVLFSLSLYTLIGIMGSIDSIAVSRRLSGVVPTRISGGILIGLSGLNMIRQLALMVNSLQNHTPVAPLQLATWIDDFIFIPAMLLGGIFLWRKKPLGYATGAGLSIVYGVLSLGLIPFLAIQAALKHQSADITGIVIVAVMAVICLIPLALFMKGLHHVNKANGNES